MERKIGETFQFQGHKLRVVEGGKYQCEECFFYNLDCSSMMHAHGFCSEDYRKDKRNVIFVEAKDKPEKQQAEQPQELDLCEILKNCPKGTEFWSDNYGTVKFVNVGTEWDTPIKVELADGRITYYTEEGWCSKKLPANCLLWPSRDCRDWSKFTAPWYKKEKFDPKTLTAFDKVLVFDSDRPWTPLMFTYLEYTLNYPRMQCFDFVARKVIPYNDDTKHLVGTKDEAPEFYRYWDVDEELDKTERGESEYGHTNVK